MGEMARTIIHADLGAFYASVEQLDRPELRGRPVVVGGSPEQRGVVAAASYEARAFGVRSAMPMSRALRLCPDAVRLPPRFDRYGEISARVMAVFRTVTSLVEPLSLDEAFLDATEQAASYGGSEALARHLKTDVRRVTGLTLSVGVGTNKTVAKIASDMEKPDGLVVVPAGAEASFLAPLPARALWGVGPRTEALLSGVGLRTIGDIAAAEITALEPLLGSRGAELNKMAQGLDDRAVETSHERKSIGAETTFARDLPDGPELRDELARIAGEVGAHMVRKGVLARTVAIKLRYSDFKTITRQSSDARLVCDSEEILARALVLLAKTTEPGDRFRLIGVSCSGLTGAGAREGQVGQLGLWQGP